jgi:hypothetical protein
MVATSCIFIVLFESLWNVLKVSPVERLVVVLTTMVNVGLTGTLGSLGMPKRRLDCEV